MQETSKKNVLKAIAAQDVLQEVSTPEDHYDLWVDNFDSLTNMTVLPLNEFRSDMFCCIYVTRLVYSKFIDSYLMHHNGMRRGPSPIIGVVAGTLYN